LPSESRVELRNELRVYFIIIIIIIIIIVIIIIFIIINIVIGYLILVQCWILYVCLRSGYSWKEINGFENEVREREGCLLNP